MNITEVRIALRDREEKLKAFASITIDNAFVVRGLKIIQRGDGEFFVAMPARQNRNGESQDVCHPINRATRSLVEKLVLHAYHDAVGELSAGAAVPDDRDEVASVG